MIGHQLDRYTSKNKGRGSKIVSLGTPALKPAHEGTCLFKVTPCFLTFRKSDKTLGSLPEMPFCFSLKIIPL